MGGVERSGVNHQRSLETDQFFWDTILDPSELSFPEVWEAKAGDLFGPGVQLFGEESPGTLPYCEEEEKKRRKRKIDQNYRGRLKEKRQKVADGVKELYGMIDGLKSEIVSYERDIDLMEKDLQIKNGERGKLRESIDKLEDEVAIKKGFVIRLCQDPSIQNNVLECSEQLQVALLKNVAAVLDGNCNWEDEKKGLEEDIAKLEGDNKMLKVQLQALLEKILKKDLAKIIKSDR